MLQVVINGKAKEYEIGITYREIMEENFPESATQIVLVKVNGKLEELWKSLKSSCTLEPVTLSDEAGHKTYKRSVTFLMLKAIYDLYPREEIETVRVEFSVGAGYFCTLSGNIATDDTFAKKVQNRMEAYVQQCLPIRKEVVDTKEAIEMFREYGMND